jgi:hypothetical protein
LTNGQRGHSVLRVKESGKDLRGHSDGVVRGRRRHAVVGGIMMVGLARVGGGSTTLTDDAAVRIVARRGGDRGEVVLRGGAFQDDEHSGHIRPILRWRGAGP